jgi:hypothetical protein
MEELSLKRGESVISGPTLKLFGVQPLKRPEIASSKDTNVIRHKFRWNQYLSNQVQEDENGNPRRQQKSNT